jgi:uncharacterized protein
MNNKPYALITGASLGIGKALAYECASRNINLLLIALPGKELDYLVTAIKNNYQVEVHSFAIDLTSEDPGKKIAEWVNENNFSVNILINNAGMGANGMFEYGDIDFYFKMIKLNTMAITSLTYHLVPKLKEHDEAFILNLSSIEAFMPLPYKAVYTGTKNYIYAFSLSLREEMKHYNIKVSVLCPGPTITNRGGLMRIKAHGKKSKIMVLLAKQVARIAIKQMFKSKGVIIPGTANLIMSRFSKSLPTMTRMRLLEKMFRMYRTEKPVT